MDYYSPRDINFSREQCLWIMVHYDIIAGGNWPPDPQGTGYVDPGVPSHRTKAYGGFEVPAQIFSEMDSRLNLCSTDGMTLLHEVTNGLEDYQSLSNPARSALNYCSGWRRRKTTYVQWCAVKRFRQKSRIRSGVPLNPSVIREQINIPHEEFRLRVFGRMGTRGKL